MTSPSQTVSATTGASTRLSPRRVLADLPTLTPRPVPSLSVMAGVFCGVAAVAAVTYWPQISHAAFFRDDWTFAYHRLTHPHHYVLFGLHNAVTHNRPVYVLANNWLSALFGNDATALLVVGLVVDALVCTAAFVLLNVLGIARWTAALIAALLIVYPLADSTRLMWSIATTNLGTGFYLVGATVAIRALTKPPPQSRRLHLVAVAFYLLSLLSYENAAGFIVFSFLVYRLVVPWRAAIARWALDIAILGTLFGAFLIANRLFGEHVNGSLAVSHLPGRLGVFAYESVGALALTIFPAGAALVTRSVVVSRTVALVGLLAVAIGGYAWLGRRGVRLHMATIRRWGWTIAAGTVALVLAYLPYVIAAGDYHPLERGEGNRINQLAALPLLVIACGLLVIVWKLAVAAWSAVRPRAGAPRREIHAMILVVALIVVSALTVRADITRWQYTARRQRQLQASVVRALAGKSRRFAVVVMGPLDLFSPGVPHAAPRAVINLRGTFSVPLGRALGPEYLVAPDTRFTCGATTLSPAFSNYPESRYGQTLLLRSPALRPTVIGDRRQCLKHTAGTHD